MEEKCEKPKDLDYHTWVHQLLSDWAKEHGVLDEWEEELEKLARKESPDRLPTEVLEKIPEREDTDKKAAEIMSKFLDIPLTKQRFEIYGKRKEFDVANVEHEIVGDVKNLGYKGSSPSAQMEFMSEHIWLMEKLEASTGKKWRKMIVGLGNRQIFETYKRRYDPWLGDVEIYFIDDEDKVHKIR